MKLRLATIDFFVDFRLGDKIHNIAIFTSVFFLTIVGILVFELVGVGLFAFVAFSVSRRHGCFYLFFIF